MQCYTLRRYVTVHIALPQFKWHNHVGLERVRAQCMPHIPTYRSPANPLTPSKTQFHFVRSIGIGIVLVLQALQFSDSCPGQK